MPNDHLRGHLDLLLLSVLSRGPAHGYAVIAALRAHSGDAVDLPEGTVYPALHRLERAGLLVSQWDDGTARRRRRYEITPAGTAALAARRDEWRSFAGGVQAILRWAT
ncbi:MAG TPA: helix-turn-helix transcriptional regulator [Pseudonocardiaceae bacterium]